MFSNDATGRTASDGFKVGIRDDGTPFIWSYENQPMHFGTNINIRMTIDGLGNVGIGTDTPTSQLHTTGSVTFEGAGTPGNGKVLTSDATGNATWETPASSASLWTDAGSYISANTNTNARVYDEGSTYGIYYKGSCKYGVHGYTTSSYAGASGVYGYTETATAGTGYLFVNSISAVKGHCLYGNAYHFGVHGDTYSTDGSPTAGVIGTFTNDSNIWGALCYKHTDDNTYAGYFEGDVKVNGKVSPEGYTNTGLPLAYGFVNSDGTLNAGTSNISSITWNSDRYEITISGEAYFYNNYVTIITPTSSAIKSWRVTSIGGDLVVYLYDSSDTEIQGYFQFITYKP